MVRWTKPVSALQISALAFCSLLLSCLLSFYLLLALILMTCILLSFDLLLTLILITCILLSFDVLLTLILISYCCFGLEFSVFRFFCTINPIQVVRSTDDSLASEGSGESDLAKESQILQQRLAREALLSNLEHRLDGVTQVDIISWSVLHSPTMFRCTCFTVC